MKCGGIVSYTIVDKDKVLMIKEGKQGDSYGMWNLPSGRLEVEETIVNGAIREAKEETGLDVKGEYITGVYKFISASGMTLIRFNFIEEYSGGELVIDNEEIIDIKWMKMDEVIKMTDNKIWNSVAVKRIVKDAIDGKKISSDFIISIQ